LAALSDFRQSPLFSEEERLVLELAEAMTSTPCEVPEDLRATLEQRFSKKQFLELCSAIAWENHRARLNRALGVREMGFSDGAFCVLPETEPRSPGLA
jgi:alkylhydroperoxidase family enzyme